jgi:hypothetical protein
MATAVFKGDAAAGSAGAVAGGGAPCELLFAMPLGRVALSPGQRCTLGRGVELGGREGAALALAQEECRVALTFSGPRSPSLSALHATVTMGEDTRWRICDPGSLNGVFHNLARISAPTVLSHGDRIDLCSPWNPAATLLFVASQPEPARAAPPATPTPASPAVDAASAESKVLEALACAERRLRELVESKFDALLRTGDGAAGSAVAALTAEIKAARDDVGALAQAAAAGVTAALVEREDKVRGSVAGFEAALEDVTSLLEQARGRDVVARAATSSESLRAATTSFESSRAAATSSESSRAVSDNVAAAMSSDSVRAAATLSGSARLSPTTALEPVDEVTDAICDGDEWALVDVIGIDGGSEPNGSAASREPTLKRACPEDSDGQAVVKAPLLAEGRG